MPLMPLATSMVVSICSMICLARIAENAEGYRADQARHLVFLGDYIDRGSESRGVVERLLADPLPGFSKVYLMGNHEEAMLAFLEEQSDGLDWLSFGGLETLLSYGVPHAQYCRAMRMRWCPCASRWREPCRRAMSISSGTAPCITASATTSSCHAGVRPGVALERQRPTDLMWIRDDFLRSKVPLPGRIVVHGHTICDLPQNRGHRINIDTGAFVSGRLTCLVLRGRRATVPVDRRRRTKLMVLRLNFGCGQAPSVGWLNYDNLSRRMAGQVADAGLVAAPHRA